MASFPSNRSPIESVARRILIVRGQRVLLDTDLAALYAVETRALTQAVKRNVNRFPADFVFQLAQEEWEYLRSQSVTLNGGRGRHPKYLPYVFAEHGALMLASVPNSEGAVEMSVLVVRAFVRLRELLASNKVLTVHLRKLEQRLDLTDEVVAELYAMIRELMTPPNSPKRKIGFV